MALKTRKVTNVTAQRKNVEAVIVAAQATQAALIAAEHSLDSLDNTLAAYSA